MTIASDPKRNEHDLSLVERILAGNDRAFTELYEKYQGRLNRKIMRIVRDDGLAEDLVQETFLRVHLHIRNFDPARAKFSSWILTIACNLAKNELRNKSRDRVILFSSTTKVEVNKEDFDDLFSDERLAPDRLFEKRELRKIVTQTVDELPKIYREAFIMREIEGKKYIDIARLNNTNMSTVKSRILRARNAFEKKVQARVA
jgi:RNA polymerase sigma-70 factor (ECF subfamily)